MMPLHLSKPALRVLGVAESFLRSCPRSVIAGVVMRSDLRIDGLALAMATVGGDDATEAVLKICQNLDRSDINALLLSGAVVSWFNIIDLHELYERLGLPVISLTYEQSPGLEKHLREHFAGTIAEKKTLCYQRLGGREMIRLRTGYDVYVRALGATSQEARLLLNKFTLEGRVPEPVRVARLAARAAVQEGLAWKSLL
jgi:endonuclease V-like protein UPF0215 family